MPLEKNVIALMSESVHERFRQLMKEMSVTGYHFHFANTREELDQLFEVLDKIDLLLSFSTSVIVPEKYLSRADGLSINIHAASPAYPGRDPHHFAVYDGVQQYGATMHHMTKKVDNGQIIDTVLFDVGPELSPSELMYRADESAWKLMARLFKWLEKNEPIPVSSLAWSANKKSRKDFIEHCRITCNIEEKELEKRIKAFHVDKYHNLFIEVHGKRFYYKGK